MRFERPSRRLACALALAASALAGAGAAPAAADPNQISIVQDEQRLLHDGPGAQAAALDEIRSLGAEVVKVTVNWRNIAPGGSR